jgi:hypothetical protein
MKTLSIILSCILLQTQLAFADGCDLPMFGGAFVRRNQRRPLWQQRTSTRTGPLTWCSPVSMRMPQTNRRMAFRLVK